MRLFGNTELTDCGYQLGVCIHIQKETSGWCRITPWSDADKQHPSNLQLFQNRFWLKSLTGRNTKMMLESKSWNWRKDVWIPQPNWKTWLPISTNACQCSFCGLSTSKSVCRQSKKLTLEIRKKLEFKKHISEYSTMEVSSPKTWTLKLENGLRQSIIVCRSFGSRLP